MERISPQSARNLMNRMQTGKSRMNSNPCRGLRTSLCVGMLALSLLSQHAMGRKIVLVYTFGEQADDPYTDPKSKLLEGYDRAFYGTALSGGGNGAGFGDGCIYRVTAPFRATLDSTASFDVNLADGNSLSMQLYFSDDTFDFPGQATGVDVTAYRVRH